MPVERELARSVSDAHDAEVTGIARRDFVLAVLTGNGAADDRVGGTEDSHYGTGDRLP